MQDFDRTIALMAIEIEQAEGTSILIGVTDDTVLRDHAVEVLRQRLAPAITLHDFRYDRDHLSLLEGTVAATASNNSRAAVSVTNLEMLPRDKRTEAVQLLNLQRNRFGHTGIAVILWVNQATLADISMHAADFYSWRSRTAFLEPPTDWDTLQSARRSYLQALVAQNEFINMQGLAPMRGGQIVQMRMEDIFIPLWAEQEVRPVNAARYRLVHYEDWEAESREASKETALLASAWENAWHERQREMRRHRVDIAELLQKFRAVVLGDPGTGKTTLLRYLAYTLARAQNGLQTPIQLPSDIADCLPVYIRIGEYAQHRQRHPDATLDTFAPLGCQVHQLPLPEALLQDSLSRGKVVFLLDGMDEIIAAEQRRDMVQQVAEWARAHPQCRMLVTSRLVGYREAPLGSGFPQCTIRPFDDADIQCFADKWYAALGSPENAERLVQALQEPAIHRLAANPLLLTVIALVHWRGTQLPHHRVTLYRLAAETFVDQWMSQRRVSPDDWDVQEAMQLLLPTLA